MSFKDAIAKYKNTVSAPSETSATPAAAPAAAPVAVNPPEAVNVLETQTMPETEGEPEPVKEEPAKARAPRGSKKGSSAPAAPGGSGLADAKVEDLAQELVARGFSVTLHKS